MGRCLAAVGVAVVVAACALPKPTPPPPARTTSLGLSIKSMTLPNGLPVVLVTDPHASEVQVTMRYRVGAGDDLEHPGIAHLVEHLMFEQTLGTQTLMAHLEENATFHNAYTSFDATTYVSRARPDYLDKLLSIEAVRLGFRCTSITDSAFLREREVVTQEIKLRDDSTELMIALHSALYPDGHPYRQAIGGSVDSVSAITRDQACKFADAYYAPENAALVISGNLAGDAVVASLGKFLARIPRRVGAAPNPVAAARKLPARELPAPLDDKAVLVMWPLPSDSYTQMTLRVMAAASSGAIDGRIKGRIDYIELGDVRAPMFGYIIEPRDGESFDDVLKAVEDTLMKLPGELESRLMPERVFDALRQRAIYGQYASLEDGSGRDMRLAAHVLARRDPAAALSEEFRALRNLSKTEAADVVRRHLTFADASVVKLKPTPGKKRGRAVAVRPATHDMGQRRSTPDLARAREPDTSLVVPSVNAVTRVLPNGLKIVLLPLSTVPTVDVRLVFGAGSADDPTGKGGTAMIAANVLTWDLRYLNDIFSFSVAGGSFDANVTRDRTSFVVQGVDMHLDYLLAGLRRLAVDGRYDDDSDALLDAFRRERKRLGDDDALDDAWYSALFGAGHPYARAGLLQYTSTSLSLDDAERFRRAYFTPDNATLVVAGRVDVDVANRWIDYLFTDWQGRAQPRRSTAAKLATASLAKVEDLDYLYLWLALAAPEGSRAQRLVAAAMLDDVARDVRDQLGASYAFGAELAEHRQTTTIVIGGSVDPARTADVVKLLRDRVQALRSDPTATARAFIAARSRVVTALASLTGGASRLAARAEHDVALGRTPLADLQTAKDVQALTVDQIAPLLAELDLSRAAVMMRGPADPMTATFASLGRTPTVIRVDPAKADNLDDPMTTAASTPTRSSREQRLQFSDIEEALTDQGFATKSRLEITAAVTGSWATLSGDVYLPGQTVPIEKGASGLGVAAEIGARLTKRFSAGLQLGIASLSGDYEKRYAGVVAETVPYSLLPLELGVFVHSRILDKVWGGLTLGAHRVGLTYEGETTWSMGFGFGVELGYDVISFGAHSIAVMLRANASYGSDMGFGGVGAGVAYRH